MYYSISDLSKARSAYEKLLERKPDDKLILGRLATIMTRIAKAQEQSGDKTAAEASLQMAATYLSRIEPGKNPSTVRGDTADVKAPIKTTSDKADRTIKAGVEPLDGIKASKPVPVRPSAPSKPPGGF